MNEIIAVFKSRKKIMLALLTMVVYAGLLIPLKPFQIIPGISEVRPANAIPVAFGILFGPAAAWGAAAGNLIADFFGTLSYGSIFGFIGNFLLAYISYKLWKRFVKRKKVELNAQQLAYFWVAGFVASAVCSAVIAVGVYLFRLAPSQELLIFVFITFNNFIPAAVLGPVVMKLLYGEVKKRGLLY